MTTNKRQVVILGAGYGGLRTALKLEGLLKKKKGWRILLVDQYDYHQLKTELHEVAADRTNFETITIPIAELIKGKKSIFSKLKQSASILIRALSPHTEAKSIMTSW